MNHLSRTALGQHSFTAGVMRFRRSAAIHVYRGLSVAAALVAFTAEPGDAQVTTHDYFITTSIQTSAGTAVTQETLSLRQDGEKTRLSLRQDDSALSVPVTLTRRGQIASSSQDGAITCYNMAMDAVTHSRETNGEVASVFVNFGQAVVRVPLTVRSAQTRGAMRTVTFDGASNGTLGGTETTVAAGIIIDATIDEANGSLSAATFNEAHYVKSPSNVVIRSSCTLRRAQQRSIVRT